MLRIFKYFFQRNKKANKKIENLPFSSAHSAASDDEYFIRELKACPYIKIEAHERVLKHFRHEESLTKTNNKLTAAEKNKIGLNPRLSITRELIEILSEDGIALENPKQLLRDIYNKATIEKMRDEKIARALSLGIKKFKYRASLEDCCDWCKKNDGKEFGVEVISRLNSECTCRPYCGGVIMSKIEF